MAARWIDEEAPQTDEDVVSLNEDAPETEQEAQETVSATDTEAQPQLDDAQSRAGGGGLAEPDDDLPEKYRGKTAAQIAQMHMEAEKLLGRHSSEVGELRRAFDEFVTRGNQQSAPPAKEEASDTVDFFVDPDSAIDSKIGNHPAVKRAEQAAAQMQAQAELARLHSAHPDYREVIADPKFAEWVKSDPVRVELFRRADTNYDFASANNLISTWKDKVGTAKVAVEAEKADRSRQVKQAGTGASKPSSDGSKVQKKKFRRADIIKLMREDPERYEAMQPEIIAAYREERVI